MGDVLMNIGDRGMYYQSESTGGGGLTSMVILLELRDAAGMAKAHAKLVDRLNELAADEIDGYARVQTWDNNGVPTRETLESCGMGWVADDLAI